MATNATTVDVANNPFSTLVDIPVAASLINSKRYQRVLLYDANENPVTFTSPDGIVQSENVVRTGVYDAFLEQWKAWDGDVDFSVSSGSIGQSFLTALNTNVQFGGFGVIPVVYIFGTYSMTIAFEYSTDATNWDSAYGARTDTGRIESTSGALVNVRRGWRFPYGNGVSYRLRCSSYTSGTCSVVVPSVKSFFDPLSATVATISRPDTGTFSSVSATTSSTTILAANALRKGATIDNDSAATLYILLASGTASSTNRTFALGASERLVLDADDYTGIIVGVWSSATGAARITEFV